MARVVFTDSADADNDFILADLAAKGGVIVAEKYSADFEALYQLLAQFPGSGAPRPAFGALVRLGIVWPYNVFYLYTQDDETVTVMRILHGRQHVTRRMLNRALKTR